MNITVVRSAKSWVGTPYVHQMSVKGAGCDCLGLVRGVWREVLGKEPETPPAYSQDWSEASGQERLWAAALRHLTPCAAPEPGAVVLFRMKDAGVAKHLGIMSGTADFPTFIHAYSGHGVVESALSAPWGRRIVAQFHFPAGA